MKSKEPSEQRPVVSIRRSLQIFSFREKQNFKSNETKSSRSNSTVTVYGRPNRNGLMNKRKMRRESKSICGFKPFDMLLVWSDNWRFNRTKMKIHPDSSRSFIFRRFREPLYGAVFVDLRLNFFSLLEWRFVRRHQPNRESELCEKRQTFGRTRKVLSNFFPMEFRSSKPLKNRIPYQLVRETSGSDAASSSEMFFGFKQIFNWTKKNKQNRWIEAKIDVFLYITFIGDTEISETSLSRDV